VGYRRDDRNAGHPLATQASKAAAFQRSILPNRHGGKIRPVSAMRYTARAEHLNTAATSSAVRKTGGFCSAAAGGVSSVLLSLSVVFCTIHSQGGQHAPLLYNYRRNAQTVGFQAEIS